MFEYRNKICVSEIAFIRIFLPVLGDGKVCPPYLSVAFVVSLVKRTCELDFSF